MEKQRVILGSAQVLNLGYHLRQRLEAVASAEQLDRTALGRRIIEAAVTAREQDTRDGGEPS
jgi:hypothetical protein